MRGIALIGIAACLVLGLAACRSSGSTIAPPALRSAQAEFGLDLEPVRTPTLMRYRGFGNASLEATQQAVVYLEGQALIRRDVLHGVMKAEPAGEGLVRVTTSYVVSESTLSPFLPRHAFERISLMTDLGDIRSEQWVFDDRDRVTRPVAIEVALAIESLFPRVPWPEQPLSADLADSFNRAGSDLDTLAPAFVLDRVQMHASRDPDGGRSIVLAFSNPSFRPSAGRGAEQLGQLPAFSLHGVVRADPAIGFPVEMKAIGRGSHLLEGRRLDFELQVASWVRPHAAPGS